MNPLLPIQNVILILGALALLAGGLAWRSSADCGRSARPGICALRIGGIASLSLPFLNPGHWIVPPAESNTEWAVLVDCSASMATPDAGGGSRLEAAQNLARAAEKLAGSHGKKIAAYAFDGAAVRPLQARESPAAETPATDIAGATASLVSRYSAGSPALEGILLLSDGRQVAATPAETAILPARSTEVRIFAVPLGGPVANPDVSVQTGRRQYTVFKGQELKIQANVSSNIRRSVELRLVETSGRVLQNQTVRLVPDEPAQAVFVLKGLPPGYQDFRIETDALENEKDTFDNRSRFGVQVLDETIRVLLVEGSPYWDSKFIAQLLQRERNYAFELVYRLSEKRFFSLATAEGKQDLSMIQRAAFPSEAAELAGYDLIILGRSVEGFFDPARAALLADWVKNGGALVLARGNPVTTGIPALEPLFPMTWDTPVDGEFHWRPTATGEEAGLFGADLPGRNAPIWKKLPPLHKAAAGTGLKPFAQVLVEGVAWQGQRESRFPLIVSRRFGEGQVVAVNCDDLWRWGFFPAFPEAAQLYRDFWLQLFNWVVSYSDFLPGRNFALKVSHQVIEVGKPVRVRVMRRPGTEKNAVPRLAVSRDGADIATLDPTASAANPDQWDSVFPLDQPGLHTVQLRTDEASEPLHATIFSMAPPGERSELSADPSYLGDLAEKTGGRLLGGDQLASMFEDLVPPPRETEGTAEWKSSWDNWMWLLPMLGFFAGEWLLRRRNGLI
ncbi:MAG: hypothetical protein WC076_07680 [Terrimicrobiaceae bacterium]